MIGQNQGDTASKFVVASHGSFKRSARHSSHKTFSLTGDTAADELKNRYRSPLLEGNKKSTAAEGEYNRSTITPVACWH